MLGALLCVLLAVPVPRPRDPPLWLVVEALYAAPGGESSRGPGAGARLGYRITDQVSTAIGFSSLFARGGLVTALAAGFEATLDATPVAPFIELSLVRTDPPERVGFSLAQRSGFGFDWRFARGLSLGLVVRYFAALDATDAPVAASSMNGIEFGLRLLAVPGASR